MKKMNLGDQINELGATLLKDKDKKPPSPARKPRSSAIPNLLIIIVVILIFGTSVMIARIPAGHVGVQYSVLGGIKDSEFSEGWNIKEPWVTVTEYSIRSQVYTMTMIQEEGQMKTDDRISVITAEGLTVDLDISVRYKIVPDKASDIHQKIGPDYESLIIRPVIRSTIRSVASQRSAKEIYGEQREEVENEIFVGIEKSLLPDGIIIEEVLLRNVGLPQKIKTAIEEKLDAEQQAERMLFVLEKEEREAERKVIESKGIANATVVRAEGEARALKIINDVLHGNPDLLRYKYLEMLGDKDIKVVIAPTSDGMPVFMPLDVEGSDSSNSSI